MGRGCTSINYKEGKTLLVILKFVVVLFGSLFFLFFLFLLYLNLTSRKLSDILKIMLKNNMESEDKNDRV